MDQLSIGILVVVLLIIVEAALMLIKLKVDKMLLLMPVIGVLCATIAFVLSEYRDKILGSLSKPAALIVIYLLLAVGIILAVIGIMVWLKGEKAAKRIISAAKGIDSAVSSIDSDIRGSEMEIEHFDDEMNAIKTKMADYESKDKEV